MLVPHIFLLPLEPRFLPLPRILDTKLLVAPPGEDHISTRCPGTHDGFDEGRVVAIEDMVEWLVDGVEVDERGYREVACQGEREVIVLAERV